MTAALCDAHCHLHDARLWPKDASPSSSSRRLEGVLRRARAADVTHAVSCACHPQDWTLLEELLRLPAAAHSLQIVPAFGLHPWWARELQSTADNALSALRRTLERHPTACLGEIGLCKSARGRRVPMDVQVAAFQAQLSLAAELRRTCVVHCVGHYGKLLEILRAAERGLPPVLVLHSYSGPPEMVRSFLALRRTRVFFSLNAKQLTDPRALKAAACCAALPLTALLLETDAPDQTPAVEHVQRLCGLRTDEEDAPLLLQRQSEGVNEPAMVQLALLSAAQIRGVAVDELASAVFQNSKEAFKLV